MVKHTQTIRRLTADELFEYVFDHSVELALKGLGNKNIKKRLEAQKVT